jgi:hypothetical protein
VALPEEMPVNETLELDARLDAAVGRGLDAIVVNGVWPERFSAADVKRLRAASRNGHDPEAAGALRAALMEHERATTQREHTARLERESGARVLTLPFLFESELGLAEYEQLAAELARDL